LAFSSFQELAQLDHSCGQYMLGVYFYYRYWVGKSEEEGLRWFKLGAKKERHFARIIMYLVKLIEDKNAFPKEDSDIVTFDLDYFGLKRLR
jgi:TPR repeat protein